MPKSALRYDVFGLKQPPQTQRSKTIMPMLSRKTFTVIKIKHRKPDFVLVYFLLPFSSLPQEIITSNIVACNKQL